MRRRDGLLLVVFMAASSLVTSCAGRAPATIRAAGPFLETITLRSPDTGGTVPLEEALQRRRSTYTFTAEPVPLAELGQLLWAAQGITSPDGKHTAPSAGALYPLELYALTDTDLFHYLPTGHRAERRDTPPWREELQEAAFGQTVIGRAPALIVVTGDVARTRRKYGNRAESYMRMEAGHATQNLLLEATARGLAAVPVGGIDPASVARVLALPPGRVPLYLVPVGYPA